MKRKLLVSGSMSIFVLFFLAAICMAANIIVGQKLPELEIGNEGECVIKGAEPEYVVWHSSCLTGTVQIVEYVAARQGIGKVNKAFFDAITSENLSGQLTITQLINADDALWGTSGLVAPEVKKTKKENPSVRYVVDVKGLGRSLWGLQKKTASISILDPQGIVLYFKEGGMNAQEVQTAIEMIKKQLLNESASSSQAASMKQ